MREKHDVPENEKEELRRIKIAIAQAELGVTETERTDSFKLSVGVTSQLSTLKFSNEVCEEQYQWNLC